MNRKERRKRNAKKRHENNGNAPAKTANKIQSASYTLEVPVTICRNCLCEDCECEDSDPQYFTYKKLNFRRLRAGDADVGEGTASEKEASDLIFATLANVPVEVIKLLDIDDYESLVEVVAPLMGKRGQAMLLYLKATQGRLESLLAGVSLESMSPDTQEAP